MTPQQIQAYRELAVTLADFACNGAAGASETHPTYVAVTERRDGPSAAARKLYSSCADLPMWQWFRVGFRCKFLNREEEKNDGFVFEYGKNLNRWMPKPIGPNPYAKVPKFGDAIETGDVIVINNSSGGHVISVRQFDEVSSVLYTAEYGTPGGKLWARYLSASKSGGITLGKDPSPSSKQYTVMSHVSFARALASESLAAPDLDALKSWQAPEALISLRQRIAYAAQA